MTRDCTQRVQNLSIAQALHNFVVQKLTSNSRLRSNRVHRKHKLNWRCA